MGQSTGTSLLPGRQQITARPSRPWSDQPGLALSWCSTGVNYLHPAASYNIRERWLNLPGWGCGGRLGDRKCRRAPNSYPLDRFVELVTVVLSDRPKPSVVLLCCQMCMLHAMAYGPPATRKADAASLLLQPEYCVAWLRRLTGIVTTARSHVVPPAKETMRIIREALPAHGSQY